MGTNPAIVIHDDVLAVNAANALKVTWKKKELEYRNGAMQATLMAKMIEDNLYNPCHFTCHYFIYQFPISNELHFFYKNLFEITGLFPFMKYEVSDYSNEGNERNNIRILVLLFFAEILLDKARAIKAGRYAEGGLTLDDIPVS